MEYAKLDPAFKDKWCKALRSGSYEQGRGALRRADVFCCIGVACDLVDPEGWAPKTSGRCWREYGLKSMGSDLAKDLKIDNDALMWLVSLNDNHMADFHQIADWIEGNL